MTQADADRVLAIYQLGIEGKLATFETRAPTWAEFDARRLPDHRMVATANDGTIVGWVACIPYSWREAYRGVVEHGVYVHPSAHGHGVGTALLQALVASTEAAGIWCVQSGIFRDNLASLALHRKAGFREIGYRERVGALHGVWHDVILVERRSKSVG